MSKDWGKYHIGDIYEWHFSYCKEKVCLFQELSGDFSPLHSDTNFAKSMGFESEILHGMLMASQISRLVGQELPTKKVMLLSTHIEFINASFVDTSYKFKALLIEKIESVSILKFKCFIVKDSKNFMRGTVEVIMNND